MDKTNHSIMRSNVLSVHLIILIFLAIVMPSIVSCDKEISNEPEEKTLSHEDSLALGLIKDVPNDNTDTTTLPPTPPAKTTVVMIDSINYNLNEDEKTAKVIRKDGGYKGNIIIPETVQHNGDNYTVIAIWDGAFYDNRELLSVTVKGERLQSIGAIAFVWCHLLSEVHFPNSVEEIGWRAFHNCGLTSINLPNNLKEIPKEAFRACGYLKEVKLPDNLITIGEQAFYDCPIEEITLPKTIKEIGTEALTSPKLRKVICYALEVPTTDYSTFYWKQPYYPFKYVNKSIWLYVPRESISLYSNTEPWKNCYSISAIEDGLLW